MMSMATSQHKNPCPKGHEIYYFGVAVLGYHYYILSLSDLCLGVEKKIFLKKYIILHFLTRQVPPLEGGGHKFTISLSYPYRCYTPNLVMTGLVVLQKKILTDDARRTPQLIAIGHLNDSDDLKRPALK